MPKPPTPEDRRRTIRRQALIVCLCVAIAMFAGSIALSVLYVQSSGAKPGAEVSDLPPNP